MDEAFLNWNPFADVEPYKTMLAEGWKYQDFPAMPEEAWSQILGIIGEGNYELLTYMERTFKGDERLYKRGQIMINPAGIENVRKYKASKMN